MILSTENQKWLAEKVDDAIKLNGILELIDGYLAKVLISLIDQTVEKKVEVPELIKTALNDIVVAAKDKNVDKVEEVSAELLDSLIDIPGLDDESEALLFEGAVKIIVGAIKGALAKK